MQKKKDFTERSSQTWRHQGHVMRLNHAPFFSRWRLFQKYISLSFHCGLILVYRRKTALQTVFKARKFNPLHLGKRYFNRKPTTEKKKVLLSFKKKLITKKLILVPFFFGRWTLSEILSVPAGTFHFKRKKTNYCPLLNTWENVQTLKISWKRATVASVRIVKG